MQPDRQLRSAERTIPIDFAVALIRFVTMLLSSIFSRPNKQELGISKIKSPLAKSLYAKHPHPMPSGEPPNLTPP